MLSVFGWTLPDGALPELTPEQERAAIIRSLAGPYAGPNRWAVATIIADRIIAIRDRNARA